MPYDLRIENGVIVVRFEGTISTDDLERSLEAVESIEATAELTPDRIIDLSRSSTAYLSFDVVEALALRRRNARLRNTVKSAIYAPTDGQYGLSRMFQMLNENPRIEVAVMRDLGALHHWLGNGRHPDAAAPGGSCATPAPG